MSVNAFLLKFNNKGGLFKMIRYKKIMLTGCIYAPQHDNEYIQDNMRYLVDKEENGGINEY